MKAKKPKLNQAQKIIALFGTAYRLSKLTGIDQAHLSRAVRLGYISRKALNRILVAAEQEGIEITSDLIDPRNH